jgi:dipeptidyl aminopeptidase/acylaminoacyl peptidase
VDYEAFDVSPDGRRLLLLVGSPSRPTQINLVLHGL